MKPVVVALAMLCVSITGCFEGQPRHHVSASEQRALPADEFALGDSLCPAKYVPRRLAESWRARAIHQYRALRIALRRHPDYFVTAHYELSDPEGGENPHQSQELTVFQLAQTHISAISAPPEEPDVPVEGADPIRCRLRMRAELVRLLGGPDRAEPNSAPIAHVP